MLRSCSKSWKGKEPIRMDRPALDQTETPKAPWAREVAKLRRTQSDGFKVSIEQNGAERMLFGPAVRPNDQDGACGLAKDSLHYRTQYKSLKSGRSVPHDD